jgi:hypothetical protein
VGWIPINIEKKRKVNDQSVGDKINRPFYNKNPAVISVTCYSGFRLNERPIKFIYHGKEILIKKILDSAVKETLENRTKQYYFTVTCESNETFTLYYDTGTDCWFLY